jgi:hypothetical protein
LRIISREIGADDLDINFGRAYLYAYGNATGLANAAGEELAFVGTQTSE